MPVTIAWMHIKDAIVGASGCSRDALHIGLGFALFLAFSAVSRARTGSMRAWAAVLAIALANEILDLRNDVLFSGAARNAESWHDVVYTMTLPTLVLSWTHALLAFAGSARIARYRPVRV